MHALHGRSPDGHPNRRNVCCGTFRCLFSVYNFLREAIQVYLHIFHQHSPLYTSRPVPVRGGCRFVDRARYVHVYIIFQFISFLFPIYFSLLAEEPSSILIITSTCKYLPTFVP